MTAALSVLRAFGRSFDACTGWALFLGAAVTAGFLSHRLWFAGGVTAGAEVLLVVVMVIDGLQDRRTHR